MIATHTQFIDLKALGLLQVSGAKSFEFLQGQLSCDVTEVTPTQSRLGVHCNAKGRVLATFRVFYKAPYYYLLLPYSMVSLLLKDLGKYAPFYKITLEDKSDAFQKIGCVGPDVAKTFVNYSETFTLSKNEVYTDDNITLLSICDLTPRAILLSPTSVETKLPIEREAFALWEMLDIKSGIASIYPETRGLFTPHYLNYHKKGGISFTKGCYTGQEVIARMHYLGKLKQQLYQFDLMSAEAPTPGSDILDAEGNVQGTLVMTVTGLESDNRKYKALGVIQDAAIQSGLFCNNTLLECIEKAEA